MPHSFELKKSAASFSIAATPRAVSLSVSPLTYEHEREVLSFLACADSVQAVFMTGLVRDNGLESPFNRGIFYGARRDFDRELVGVALVGHATLVETSHDEALRTFAHIAREIPGAHVHLGPEASIKQFWRHYSRGGQRARLFCRELLFEMREEFLTMTEEVEGLRLATLDDLPFVMPVQACMAFEESGINPIETDPVGFRLRCARRIEQGRVFVWIEEGRLLFKADILADTARAVYLEGVYTSPSARNQAYGSRCLLQTAYTLLERTRSVVLLVNEQNRKAQEFYRRTGFQFGGNYDTIYLQRDYEQRG
ncbi:MAG TPA: GNAT family N-acetyltransferase [Pyrinomonadaceae bacterium]|nr:GNAT family N-acetyltransferase [Pyrinomonadaceae bacterium]